MGLGYKFNIPNVNIISLKSMSDDYDYNYDGPSAGTAVPDNAQSSGAYDPANLYQAAKNLVEADGFMVIVYILAILGKSFYLILLSNMQTLRLRDALYGMSRFQVGYAPFKRTHISGCCRGTDLCAPLWRPGCTPYMPRLGIEEVPRLTPLPLCL